MKGSVATQTQQTPSHQSRDEANTAKNARVESVVPGDQLVANLKQRRLISAVERKYAIDDAKLRLEVHVARLPSKEQLGGRFFSSKQLLEKNLAPHILVKARNPLRQVQKSLKQRHDRKAVGKQLLEEEGMSQHQTNHSEQPVTMDEYFRQAADTMTQAASATSAAPATLLDVNAGSPATEATAVTTRSGATIIMARHLPTLSEIPSKQFSAMSTTEQRISRTSQTYRGDSRASISYGQQHRVRQYQQDILDLADFVDDSLESQTEKKGASPANKGRAVTQKRLVPNRLGAGANATFGNLLAFFRFEPPAVPLPSCVPHVEPPFSVFPSIAMFRSFQRLAVNSNPALLCDFVEQRRPDGSLKPPKLVTRSVVLLRNKILQRLLLAALPMDVVHTLQQQQEAERIRRHSNEANTREDSMGTLFRKSWLNLARFESTPYAPGSALASDSSGSGWGMSDTFDEYNGKASNFVNPKTQASAGVTQMLLQRADVPFGWQGSVLDLRGWHVTPHHIQTLSSFGEHIEDLKLTDWQSRNMDQRSLGLIFNCFPKLCRLALPGCPAFDSQAAELLAASTLPARLTELNISRSEQLDDLGLVTIGAACIHLEDLCLSGCAGITDKALISLSTDLAKLKSLDLSWCLRITDQGVIPLLARCPVEHFSVRGLGMCVMRAADASKLAEQLGFELNTPSKVPVGWHLLEAPDANVPIRCAQGQHIATGSVAGDMLVAAFPGLRGGEWLRQTLMDALVEVQISSLRTVDLSLCVGVTDEVVISLLRNSAGLERIRLSHCSELTAASTTAIAIFCPEILEIYIPFCTGISSPIVDRDIALLLAKRAGIIRDENGALSSEADAGITAGISEMIRQKERKRLRYSVSFFPGDDIDVDSQDAKATGHIPALQPKWNKLRLLNASGSSGIQELDFSRLVRCCAHLETLHCSGVHNVSGSLLEVLRPLSLPLIRISLGHLPALDDSALKTLVQCAPDLLQLDITGSTSVSDAGLAHISMHCPLLEEFRFNGCSQSVSCGAVMALAKSCRLLKVLEVSQRSDKQNKSERAGPFAAVSGSSEIDYSFDGNLLLFVVGLGLCCPYLEVLDVSGRSLPRHSQPPRGLAASIQLEGEVFAAGSARGLVQRARATDVLGISTRSSGRISSLLSGQVTVEDLVEHHGRNLVSTSFRATRKQPQEQEALPQQTSEVIPLVASKHGPVAIESMFSELKNLNLSFCSHLSTGEAEQLIAAAPQLLQLDLTGIKTIDTPTLAALGNNRELVNFSVEYEDPSAGAPERSAILGFPGQRPGSRSNMQLGQSLASESKQLLTKGAEPAYSSKNREKFVGFRPVPGASFLIDSTLTSKRIGLERVSANKIRRLILHGLRIEKQLLFTITWRVATKRAARLQYSARRVTRFVRHSGARVQQIKQQSVAAIAMWWRRLQLIFRCQERVIAALHAKRAAQTKVLAASLMVQTFNSVWQRLGFNWLRMRALVGRWEDERRINRLRGLVPRYDGRGRLNVQFALPDDGPELLGRHGPAASTVPPRPETRQGTETSTLSTRMAIANQNIPPDALMKLVQDQGGLRLRNDSDEGNHQLIFFKEAAQVSGHTAGNQGAARGETESPPQPKAPGFKWAIRGKRRKEADHYHNAEQHLEELSQLDSGGSSNMQPYRSKNHLTSTHFVAKFMFGDPLSQIETQQAKWQPDRKVDASLEPLSAPKATPKISSPYRVVPGKIHAVLSNPARVGWDNPTQSPPSSQLHQYLQQATAGQKVSANNMLLQLSNSQAPIESMQAVLGPRAFIAAAKKRISIELTESLQHRSSWKEQQRRLLKACEKRSRQAAARKIQLFYRQHLFDQVVMRELDTATAVADMQELQADIKRGMHRQAHSGAASKHVIKSAIILQKAARRHSAQIYALHIRHARALSMAADALRVAAAQVSGFDGEFQANHLIQSCNNAKECLLEALNAKDALGRKSPFFRASRLAAAHRDETIRAMQMCSNIPTGLTPTECQQAAAVIAEVLSAIRGERITGLARRQAELLTTENKHSTIGSLYNSQGTLLGDRQEFSIESMIGAVEVSISRRLAAGSKLGQWLWLQDKRGTAASTAVATISVVGVNAIQCSQPEALDILYLIGASGAHPSFSAAISDYLQTQHHVIKLPPCTQTQRLPGPFSSKTEVNDYRLLKNRTESTHEVVCGTLNDVAVLLEKHSEIVEPVAMSEYKTCAVAARSRGPDGRWTEWSLIFTAVLKEHLVPIVRDTSALESGDTAFCRIKVSAACMQALQSGKLGQAAKNEAVRQASIAAHFAAIKESRSPAKSSPRSAQEIATVAPIAGQQAHEPKDDSVAAQLVAEFSSHQQTDPTKQAAHSLAFEIYLFGHGFLDWGSTIAYRLARERRHWNSRCLYQRQAQSTSLAVFKAFFEEELVMLVGDAQAMVETSQSQSHDWISRWQRSFNHLQRQAESMPKFSDISCRLNYERQQLRVALMRSRMTSEQSHVSFAKQGLLVLTELHSQQESLLFALQQRTTKEASIILQLEKDIPRCENIIEFVRARLGKLVLSMAQRDAASKQSRHGASAVSSVEQDESEELAALVSMMSGEVDDDLESDYGAASQGGAASQSESDAPHQTFERILQVEPIDSEWERIQIEKIVEVEVPVPFPWQDSDEWTEHRNSAGQVYFFNKSTKQSQWEEPDWPSSERPPPITEKVHKVEWAKRRCANSNHERRKRAKNRRRQSFQARSSYGVVQRLLTETNIQTFDSGVSPQERQTEVAWLIAELHVLEDTLERLQNVLFLTTASFHSHNVGDQQLLCALQSDLDSLQKAVEEHRRAKVEVLQLNAEIATDQFFTTNQNLVHSNSLLRQAEKKHSKFVKRLFGARGQSLATIHDSFSKLMPLKKSKFAIVRAANQPKPHAPRRMSIVEKITTLDENGDEVTTEQRVMKLTAHKRRRFRHARVAPTAKSLVFYSVTNDGEDVGNQAFWYAGTSAASLFGLFGVEVRFAPGREQGRNSSSSSGSEAEESAEHDADRVRAEEELERLKEFRQEKRDQRRKKASRALRRRTAQTRKSAKHGSQKLFSDFDGTPAEGQHRDTVDTNHTLNEYVGILQSTISGFDRKSLEQQSQLAKQASLDVLASSAYSMQIARNRGKLSSEIFVEALKSYPARVSSESQEHFDALISRPSASSKLVAQSTTQPVDLTKVLPKSSPPELRLLSRASTHDRSDGEFVQMFRDELEAEQVVDSTGGEASILSQNWDEDVQNEQEMQEIARRSPFPWERHPEEWVAGMSAPRTGAWGSSYFVHLPSKLALWAPPSVATRTSMLESVRKARLAETSRKAELEARKAADLKVRRQAAKLKFISAVADLQDIRKNSRQICHRLQSEAPDATENFLNQPPVELVLALVKCTKAARLETGHSTSEDFEEYNMRYPYIDWTQDGALPSVPSLGNIVCKLASKAELAALTNLIFNAQAEIDSRDRKEWWNLMGLTDEQDTESRGFGGGAYFADPPEQYGADLKKALDRAVDRLLKCEADEQTLRFRILKKVDQLHDAVARQPAAVATTSVKALRDSSTEESDTIARRKFDRASRKRIQAAQETLKLRLAQKARLIFDIAEESGTTQEELISRLRERARAAKMAKRGVASVQPDEVVYDSDEEAFFEWKRDNTPKFVSEGFKGVIGPDGSALQFLGDGTRFDERLWLHRFKLRPWATGAKLLESLSIGQQANALGSNLESVDLAVLKDYKLGLSSMASSGLESKRERLEEKRRRRDAAQKARADEELRIRAEKIRRKIEREVTKQQDFRRQVGVNSGAQAKLTTKEIKSADRDTASTLAMAGRKGMIKKLGDGIATKMASFSRSIRDSTRKILKGDAPELNSNGYQVHRVLVSDTSDAELRQRTAEGKLAAIHTLRLVGGRVANAHLARAQARQLQKTNSLEGIYFKLKGNLGTEDFPVHLWYTRTSNMLEAAGHMILNSLSAEDPLFDDLQFNGYNYYTDAKVLPGHALWLLRGTGAPVTSMAISTDAETETRLRSQRFIPVQGGWGDTTCIASTSQLFYKTEVVLRVNAFQMDETRVYETELYHLRQLHAIVDERIKAAKKEDSDPKPADIEKDNFLQQ